MNGGLLYQAFIYLGAAVLAVPVAKRLGLGSVLGYLIAGAAIGPSALALVGTDGQDVLHFAEFGVVMMLFLIGLELEPEVLWKMRGPILGTGGMQVAVTAAAIGGVGLALGFSWQSSLAVGMTLALSSTAIVLQTLNEKGLLRTDSGQTIFSVLLFQDIAVIPMLALFPLLADPATLAGAAHAADATHAVAGVDGLPAWQQTLLVLAAVSGLVLAGRYLARPAFRFVAGARLHELFTAAALLLVVGTTLLMERVGLSPALGAFLAGVVLAGSEYRHHLESDIEPFKGLLLGLFFIAVGASIDFGLIGGEPGLIVGLAAALVAIKFVVLLAIGAVRGMGTDSRLIFSFALAQGSEFAFVLLSFATQNGVLTSQLANPLVAAVAISMAVTPLMILLNERLLLPNVGTLPLPRRDADVIDHESPVILAGFGRFGNVVGRFLRANGVQPTVLDDDADEVEMLRKLGLEVFYGNAANADLLRAAGAERARLLLIAVDQADVAQNILRTVRHHFPHLQVMARARGRAQAYELLDQGVEKVYRETLDSSLRMGVDALRALGHPGHASYRAAQRFRRHDEATVRDLGRLRHDRKGYVTAARQRMAALEQIMLEEREGVTAQTRDAAWDAESLRREYDDRD